MESEDLSTGPMQGLLLLLIVGPLFALLGGALSAPVALIANTLEMRKWGWLGYLLGVVLIAPWVEELAKPLGLYVLVKKWPGRFRSRRA